MSNVVQLEAAASVGLDARPAVESSTPLGFDESVDQLCLAPRLSRRLCAAVRAPGPTRADWLSDRHVVIATSLQDWRLASFHTVHHPRAQDAAAEMAKRIVGYASPPRLLTIWVDPQGAEPLCLVRIPTDLLAEGKGPRHIVYRYTFQADKADTRPLILERDTLQYIGLTASGLIGRLLQHFDSARAGSKTLFHSFLRGAYPDCAAMHLVAIDVIGVFDWIQDAQECHSRCVAGSSLFPLGLNMIPGGRDGELHLTDVGKQCAADQDLEEAYAGAKQLEVRPTIPFQARLMACLGHNDRAIAAATQKPRLDVGRGFNRTLWQRIKGF